MLGSITLGELQQKLILANVRMTMMTKSGEYLVVLEHMEPFWSVQESHPQMLMAVYNALARMEKELM